MTSSEKESVTGRDEIQLDCDNGGIESVKRIFRRKEDGRLSDEMDDVLRFSLGAFALGFVYGGLPASSLLRRRYIEKSQGEVYSHRVDAARQSQHAGVRGLIRYGWRWGWRVAALAGMFQGGSLIIALYRNKVDVLNYIAAAGISGSLYKTALGPRGMVAGGILGAVLGVPVGFSLVSLQKLAGEDVLEKFRRMKRDVILNDAKELRTAGEFLDIALNMAEKEMKESNEALAMSSPPKPQLPSQES
ncbi:complex I assembly factor TIMMDC1, mitochondrial-like [Saccoglossus kowalevskii]|uniref:Complex I assembly factor TIMMDC1, mitochondrial n=1 Tax=Saccoglossus kowalevskii TaxID=10224 RepID=A0ABM0GW14_SACKO|nr:PREDICTED: translocase of inner mitochondrial membrane domain-containing protein 1-like [Saccoglossus kowalevskii]